MCADRTALADGSAAAQSEIAANAGARNRQAGGIVKRGIAAARQGRRGEAVAGIVQRNRAAGRDGETLCADRAALADRSAAAQSEIAANAGAGNRQAGGIVKRSIAAARQGRRGEAVAGIAECDGAASRNGQVLRADRAALADRSAAAQNEIAAGGDIGHRQAGARVVVGVRCCRQICRQNRRIPSRSQRDISRARVFDAA